MQSAYPSEAAPSEHRIYRRKLPYTSKRNTGVRPGLIISAAATNGKVHTDRRHVPFLQCPIFRVLFALDNNSLIPLRIRFPRCRSRYLRRSKRLIDIHPIFRSGISVQIFQRHWLAGSERHNLITMLFVDAADHTEALVDGLILDLFVLRRCLVFPHPKRKIIL